MSTSDRNKKCFWKVERAGSWGLQHHRHLWDDCLDTSGSSASHNPKGLHGLLRGKLYFTFYISITQGLPTRHPSIHKSWHYISSTSGGRSVGIVRSRTKGHGVCLFITQGRAIPTASYHGSLGSIHNQVMWHFLWKWGTGAGFLPILQFHLPFLIPSNAPYPSNINYGPTYQVYSVSPPSHETKPQSYF
jgi:hypothetical protein